MTNIEPDDDAGLAGFLASCDWVNASARVTATYAVIGLTNFGERPVPSTRLAEVLGVPVNEAEARARQWGWPGTRVEDGLITVNPERAKAATRRHVRIGGRRFGVTGCAGDAFFYAPLARPSLLLEDTCPATGTPIRILFTPSGVQRVNPAGAVVAMQDVTAQNFAQAFEAASDIEEVDANLCAGCSLFYTSAEAARRRAGAHPGSRVLPIKKVWDLSTLRDWRDRMSALSNLGH